MSQISKEAVAGVWPIELGEAPITEVWPSISALAPARMLAKLYALPFPLGLIFGILTLPIALTLFAVTLVWRYSLTTQYVRVRTGPRGKETQRVALAELQEVRINQQPGQEFYRAADLELVSAGGGVLTLAGVPNPAAFRNNILQARDALLQVAACRRAEEVPVAAS